jgi:glycosyltransferase involved in cell wall biosynthesis
MSSVTISIMCYNYGRYLGRAIESCLQQEGHDLDVDILVIDDGSTDETPAVCQQYADSIRVLRSENKGFTASLTRSIEQARGTYVCLLDADDYFAETKLQELEPLIRDGYDLIENRSHLVGSDGARLQEEPKDGGSTSTLCVRREKALDLVPAHNEIHFHALKHLGQSKKLKEPLTYYRVHDASMIRSREAGAWYDELAEVTHKLADHLQHLARRPPGWTDAAALRETSRIYRTAARYDEMEAALLRGQRWTSLKKCTQMLRHAVSTPGGLNSWHLRLAARCLQGRAIEPSHR